MKYKRFLSVISALCMLLMIAMPNAAAEASKIEISVVSENNADKAECFLGGLGVDTEFKNSEYITRAQFAGLLVNLTYGNAVTDFSDISFEDVSDSNEYYNEINFACNADIISKNTLFRPDDSITLSEAAAMALRALGYGFVSEYYGGYPSGYIKYAFDTGISNGIYKASDEKLSGEDVLLLLYNMLDVDFMERDFRDEGVSYSKVAGKNILTHTYDLKGTSGIVTATVYSDLSGNSSVDENIIKINGKKFRFYDDSFDLLGMNVIAYINKDDEAVIVCPVKNQILKADEVEEYDNFTLEIKNGSNTKNVKLDGSFCFIYNGVAYNSYDEKKDFTNFEGYVKLVDNNGDNVYDVVFVYDVEYMKVSQIDKMKGKIYGKAVSRDYISFDEESHIRFYKSGEEVNPVNIKINDILAITISKDGKTGKAEVINNEGYGTITEISDEYIFVDGAEYRKSSHLNKYYSPTAGAIITFNVGIRNDIIMIAEEKTGEYRYGYLIDIDKEPNTDIYSVKLFSDSGEIEIYECAEKLNLDGNPIKTYKTWANNAYPLTDTSNVVQRQLIKYKLNSGIVTAIDTQKDAVSENALDQATANEKDSLLRYFNQTTGQYYTVNSVYTFQKFNVDSKTLIISVPDPSAAAVVEDDFSLKTVDSFKKDSSYTVDAYDLDENGVAGAVLLYDSSSSALSESKEFGVIERITEVWHDDLGLCKKVTFWKFGECYSYFMESDQRKLHIKEDGTPLETGDVVHIYSKNGVIKDLEVLFDVRTKELTEAANTINNGREDKTQSARAFIYSSNYKMTDKYFVVTRKKTDGKWDYSLDNLRYIPVYNDAGVIVIEDGQVKRIYSNEILDYSSAGEGADELFLVQGYWGISDIVIYR